MNNGAQMGLVGIRVFADCVLKVEYDGKRVTKTWIQQDLDLEYDGTRVTKTWIHPNSF